MLIQVKEEQYLTQPTLHPQFTYKSLKFQK